MSVEEGSRRTGPAKVTVFTGQQTTRIQRFRDSMCGTGPGNPGTNIHPESSLHIPAIAGHVTACKARLHLDNLYSLKIRTIPELNLSWTKPCLHSALSS